MAPHECEEILRWFAAFAVAVKCHLRRDERIPAIELDGVLTEEEVRSPYAGPRATASAARRAPFLRL